MEEAGIRRSVVTNRPVLSSRDTEASSEDRESDGADKSSFIRFIGGGMVLEDCFKRKCVPDGVITKEFTQKVSYGRIFAPNKEP